MNPVFTTLFNQRVHAFRRAYSEVTKSIFIDPSSGKLSHPGEFGGYREATLRDFLRLFIPGRLDIGAGFLMTPEGGVSTQLDLVVFDGEAAPRIESESHQRFFPIEVVAAIGEAKSSLNKSQFRDALNKLATAKMLAEHLASPVPIRRDPALKNEPFDRKVHAYDQVVSFLVCDSLDFDATRLPDEIDSLYSSSIPSRCRHNLVLSLRDGLLAYVDHNKKTMMYPEIRGASLQHRLVRPDANPDVHLLYFVDYLFMMTTSATILFPGMNAYLPPMEGGRNHDQGAP